MNQYFPNLFSPMELGGHVLRNRLFVAPHWADNSFRRGNELCPEMLDYYEERAKGGFAMVSPGDFPVNYDNAGYPPEGRYHFYERGDMRAENAMRDLVRRIHRHGALAQAEFTHWGRKDFMPRHGYVIGPSAHIRADGVECKEMDLKMMNDIADDFAKCAVRAKELGFDSVMIHGGHGWLLTQFLSPRDNHRTDEFGGSAENRGRFPKMVCERVRQAVGPDMIIEFRLSCVEDDYSYEPCLRNAPGAKPGMPYEYYDEPGITLEDTLTFCKMIDGIVDIIHVSGGNHTERTFDPGRLPARINLNEAAAIKAVLKQSKVSIVGGWNDPDACEAAIAEGKVDFISMARQSIADPYFPNKAMTGHQYDINTCLRCGNCMNCSVNPVPMGHEHDERVTLRPNSGSGKVVVIGGGPAGMKAAETAAKRGFQVVLFEKEADLGGKLRIVEHDALKTDLARFIRYLKERLAADPNVELRLGTEATPELVAQEAPDAVIAAVGTSFRTPDVPGIEKLPHMDVVDAFLKGDALGDRVVVVGGGQSGCDAAIEFASRGRQVTLLSRSPMICRDLDPVMGQEERVSKLKALSAYGSTVYTGCACTGISETGVYGRTQDGTEVFAEADCVVFACGETKNQKLAESFRGDYPYFRAIGDCVNVGLIGEAIYAGYYAALDI